MTASGSCPTGTRLELIPAVQIGHASSHQDPALEDLQRLAGLLRLAIRTSLLRGASELAVALDTARAFAEAVLDDPERTTSRVAIARTRAEIALEAWRAHAARSR